MKPEGQVEPPALPQTNEREARCECGHLMAKLKAEGLELKCKRCKRIFLIPFGLIEGWSIPLLPESQG